MHTLRYTAGYQPASGLRPGNLTMTLLISGGLVSAMFFVSPRFVPDTETHLVATSIPLDQPPPPDPQPKVKQPPRTVAQREIYVAPIPQPLIHDATEPKLNFTTTPPPETTMGEGTVPAKAEPVKPPLLTGAEFDQRFAANFQPAYPPDEIRLGGEGRVTVKVLIGVDGRVLQVDKVSAASDSFFEATRRRALDKWRFKPATRDGVPYQTWKVVGVSFVLDAQ